MRKIIYVSSILLIITATGYVLLNPSVIIRTDIKKGVNKKWLEEDNYSLLGSEKFYKKLTRHERWRLKHIFDFYNVDYREDDNGNIYYRGDLSTINIKFEAKIGKMKTSPKMDLESKLSYEVNNKLGIFTLLNCNYNYESCIFRLRDEDWTEENKTKIRNVAKPILGDIDYRFGPLKPIK